MYVFHGLLVLAAPAPAALSHAAVERSEQAFAFWARAVRRLVKCIANGIAGAVDAWCETQRARATRATLASLDPATLRDLGLHDSVEATRYRGREYAPHLF